MVFYNSILPQTFHGNNIAHVTENGYDLWPMNRRVKDIELTIVHLEAENLIYYFWLKKKTQEEKRRPTNVAKILCDFVLLVSDRQIKICLKSNNLWNIFAYWLKSLLKKKKVTFWLKKINYQINRH